MAKKKKVAKKPKKIATKPKVAKKAPAKPAKKDAKKAAKKASPAKANIKKAKTAPEPKKKLTPKALPAKSTKKGEAATIKKAPPKATAQKASLAPEKSDKKDKLKAKKPALEIHEGLLVDELAEPTEETKAEDVVLTDAEGRRYCRVRDCDQIAIVDAYCRYHYLLFWKKIQVRKKILTEGKLQKYIEDLTARYPDKFLEILRKDLRSEKDFMAAIMELELDETNSENESYEDEDRSFIDEVRGVTDSARVGRDEDEY